MLSAAAGLFVSPAPGPVLANYGLDTLRFVKPVGIGDTIRARLTCKRKIDRNKKDANGVGQGAPRAMASTLRWSRAWQALSRTFFALDEAQKLRIPMSAGGRAWRGYFPLGGELTSNRPDWKEGLYLGTELPPDHLRVRAGVILHGPNLWPPIEDFRETVLAYMAALQSLGHALMGGIALGLGLPRALVRRARHGRPADPPADLQLPGRRCVRRRALWGVGEHTDYGLLTILCAGRRRRPARCSSRRRLAPGAADPWLLRVQHRRHARPHDARRLPLDTASRRHQRERHATGSRLPLFFDPDFRRCAHRAGAWPRSGRGRQAPVLTSSAPPRPSIRRRRQAKETQRLGERILRVHLDRAADESHRFLHRGAAGPPGIRPPKSAQQQVVGLQVRRRVDARAFELGAPDIGLDRPDHALHDPVLKFKHVLERTVEAIRPEMAGRYPRRSAGR